MKIKGDFLYILEVKSKNNGFHNDDWARKAKTRFLKKILNIEKLLDKDA